MPIKKLDRPVGFNNCMLVDVDAALKRLDDYPSFYLGAAEVAAICQFKSGTIWRRVVNYPMLMPRAAVRLKMGHIYLKTDVRVWIEAQRVKPIVQEPAKPE
jgi:hypothetical protein